MTEAKHSQSEGDGRDNVAKEPSRHAEKEPETGQGSRAVLLESGTERWKEERPWGQRLGSLNPGSVPYKCSPFGQVA